MRVGGRIGSEGIYPRIDDHHDVCFGGQHTRHGHAIAPQTRANKDHFHIILITLEGCGDIATVAADRVFHLLTKVEQGILQLEILNERSQMRVRCDFITEDDQPIASWLSFFDHQSLSCRQTGLSGVRFVRSCVQYRRK